MPPYKSARRRVANQNAQHNVSVTVWFRPRSGFCTQQWVHRCIFVHLLEITRASILCSQESCQSTRSA
jgi:hypothetical protein